MPTIDTEKRKEQKRRWQREHKLLGLCRQCCRPVAVVNGRKLLRCEYHRRGTWKKWTLKDYVPPTHLMPLNYFSHLPVAKLAYAAGLIEGEGCFIFSDYKREASYRTRGAIRVNMVDRRPVQFLYDTFGGRIKLAKLKNEKHRPQMHWEVNGRRAGAVAAAISRYLQSPRRRKGALLTVRLSSVCGWWGSNRPNTVSPDIVKLFKRLRMDVAQWRSQSYELASENFALPIQ